MNSPRPGRSWSRAVGGLVGVTACAVVAFHPLVRDLARGGLAGFRWQAVAAMLPLQVAGLVLCGLALRALAPAISLKTCLLARWIRDAGGNLLIFAPGLGEAAGLRALTMGGSGIGAAFRALALDTLAESAAQAPYIALGLALSRPGRVYALELLRRVASFGAHASVAAPLVLTAGVILCVLAIARPGWLRSAKTALFKSVDQHGGAVATSFALHLCAWALGGVQLYVAARLMRVDLPLADALALEGLVYGLRGLCFIVPGGLGVQEAALVFGGALFGLAPVSAASLAISLRVRDLLVGAPALLAWAGMEALGNGRTARSEPGLSGPAPLLVRELTPR